MNLPVAGHLLRGVRLSTCPWLRDWNPPARMAAFQLPNLRFRVKYVGWFSPALLHSFVGWDAKVLAVEERDRVDDRFAAPYESSTRASLHKGQPVLATFVDPLVELSAALSEERLAQREIGLASRVDPRRARRELLRVPNPSTASQLHVVQPRPTSRGRCSRLETRLCVTVTTSVRLCR